MPEIPRTPIVAELLEMRRLFAAPIGNADQYVLDEDTSLVIPAGQGVLINDFDPDTDPMTAALSFAPLHGSLNLNPDGSFDYTPEADFFGNDSFSYVASDGGQPSFVTNVDLTINPVPDPGKFSFTANEFFAAEQTGFGIVSVARTGGSEGMVSVDYMTSPGTALEFQDYSPSFGTLTFFPGEFSQDIFVGLISDFQPELSESLTVTLTNPTGGAMFPPGPPPHATLTIVNSDPPPSITINDPAPVAEGNAGETTNIPFVLTLSEPASNPATVNFYFGFGGATAGEDYDDSAAGIMGTGTITFAPGETTATISVPVFGDSVNEFNESLSINLYNANGALLTDSIGVGTITNDDNVLPIANDTTIARTPGNANIEISVGSLVSSPDGDALTFAIATRPAFGAIQVNNNGTPADASDDQLTYSPGGFGFQDDSFTYSITDPYGGTDTGTILLPSTGTTTSLSLLDPTRTDLLIGGTPGEDSVRVQRTKTRGEVRVILNGVDQGAFSPTGRIVIAGGAGDDVIDARGLTMSIEAFGGAGNDTIKGGRGADMLYGLEGDDNLRGGDRRDVLVGGGGADLLAGGNGADILIGGMTLADGDTRGSQQFRAELLAAWTMSGPHDDILDDIAGGTIDGSGVFLATGSVLDDDTADLLSGAGGADWFFGLSDPEGTRDRFKGKIGEDDFTEIA